MAAWGVSAGGSVALARQVGRKIRLLLFLFLIALSGEVALIATRELGASRGMLATHNLLHYRPQSSQCPCAKPSEAGCVTGTGRAERGDRAT